MHAGGPEPAGVPRRTCRSTRLDELRAVVLDTEATGLDVTRARIVEIGAVRLEGGEAADETFATRVDPGIPIPPSATAIHGIGDDDVRGAPSFVAAADAFAAFRGDAVLVGQSIGFDLALMLRESRRSGLPWRAPQFLDTKLLYAALLDEPEEHDLDALAAALGVEVGRRHTALDDARATAEVFVRLVPRLRDAGIATLGEAEAHQSAQTRLLQRQARDGWYDATSVRPSEGFDAGRDRGALARLDPFAYQHSVRHVMKSPPLFLAPHTTLQEAAGEMESRQRGSVLLGSAGTGEAFGIVTERDLLRALARHGAASASMRLEAVMSEPVVALPEDAPLYRALARMQRLGVRHLGVTDLAGRLVGVVSARALLRERAGQAVLLGDEVSIARSPAELARARARLPDVARELLREGLDAEETARVLSLELRDLTGRAAVLAERRMEGEGSGRPPVPYAFALLGAGGRGESLLAAEQDNALVYASNDRAGAIDGWFARFGEHLSEILARSGVAPCADGVMAGRDAWRGTPEFWSARVRAWVADPSRALAEHAERLLDGVVAYGDADLAADVRTAMVKAAAGGRELARALAAEALGVSPPHDDADLEGAGIRPVTAAARALAALHGVEARSTEDRLAEVCSRGHLSPGLRDELDMANELFMHHALHAQLAALTAGRVPPRTVPLSSLDEASRMRVRATLARVAEVVPELLRRALGP